MSDTARGLAWILVSVGTGGLLTVWAALMLRRETKRPSAPLGNKLAMVLFQDDTRLWGTVPVAPARQGTKAIAPKLIVAPHPKVGNRICEVRAVSVQRDHLVYVEIDVAPFTIAGG